MTAEQNSTARDFLSRLRDHYVDQLLLFIADQRRNSIRGESEVKIELEPGSKLFRSLGCADFARNDGQPEILDLTPERTLRFEPVSTELGNAQLNIEQVQWDDVVIHHNGDFDAEQVLGGWFDRWFDPYDSRYNPGNDLGNVIHSLAIESGKITVDFGSAQPEALWELLNLLEKAGITQITITGSMADAGSA